MCWLSWFSGLWCCSCPGFHLHLGASDSSPGLAFASWALRHLVGSASAAPLPPVQKRDAQHMFLQHRGSRAESKKLQLYVKKSFPRLELRTWRPSKEVSKPSHQEKCPRGAMQTAGLFGTFPGESFGTFRLASRGVIGCTARGSCNNTLLRKFLRRFFKGKCFQES